ncbi:MAG: hypothetical protein OEZ32_07465 [Nitrospinota bacterium]|nr:hypothetical protein [Nitrospinota bacterium]
MVCDVTRNLWLYATTFLYWLDLLLCEFSNKYKQKGAQTKKRFTEEPINRRLKEAYSGEIVKEACRWERLTEQARFRRKRQFGGVDLGDTKKLKAADRKQKA